jgi:threonine/homoserine/homoserine lactone efflux protein
MSFSLLGLGALLQASALLFTVFKWAGAIYLVYSGLKFWTGKEEDSEKNLKETRKSSSELFRASFFVTVLNPKSIAFFVAFFPQFIDPKGCLHRQLLFMGSSFLFLAVLNAAMYATFAGNFGEIIRRRNIRKIFKRLTGSVLIGAGILTAAMKKS